MADQDEARIDLGIRGLGPAEHIGRGGFADVYKAEQISLRRTVAVKVLRAQASDVETEARFERECHAIGAVSDHPHIVGVHEGGFTQNGRAYLVMEYLPGGSLRDQLDSTGALPLEQVVDTAIKIARALGEAHRAGVLHRDVKPANIMISAYGEPALGDFGIARIEGGHQTATGLVTASFAHAAPEVLEGMAPTAGADIYSLGTTIFELMVGHAPYYDAADESIWPLMKRILSEPMPSPESVGMSQQLGRIFLRATERDPGMRYHDADAVADELTFIRNDPRAMTRGVAHFSGPDAFPLAEAQPLAETAQFSTGVDDQLHTNIIAGAPPVVGTPGGPPAPRPDITSLRPSDTRAMPAEQDASGRFTPTHGADRFSDPPASMEPHVARKGGAGLLVVLAVAALAAGAGLFTIFGSSFGGSDADVSTFTAFVPDANAGPLRAGGDYAVMVEGAPTEAVFRLVIDGQVQGETSDIVPSLVPQAGRHSVAVEISSGNEVETTAPVEFYALSASADGVDPAPITPGFAATLRLIDENEGWSVTMATYDELFDAGHQELAMVSSDQIQGLTPQHWVLYVPGFGEDAVAAEEYCQDFGLAIPTFCYAGYHQPNS